jgi:hypothetical protein
VADGGEQPGGVVLVEAGDGVAEAGWDPGGEASSSDAHMWDVVGRGDISSAQAVESRIEEVRSALEALPESRLADFQRWLASRLFDIDRRAYAEIPARFSDGSEMKQSPDLVRNYSCPLFSDHFPVACTRNDLLDLEGL